MHRALLLGFGLTGEYGGLMCSNYVNETEFSIEEFISTYFRGGRIARRSNPDRAGHAFKDVEAFTVDKMIALVMKEIRGPDKVAAAGAGAEDEAEDEEAKGVVLI